MPNIHTPPVITTGYNGIICLRIVAAKHCCTLKCCTINVHRAHSHILLPSSAAVAVYGPCGLKRIVHPLNSACRCNYEHVQRVRELCASANTGSFNLTAKPTALRSARIDALGNEMRGRQKADRFVSRYVALCRGQSADGHATTRDGGLHTSDTAYRCELMFAETGRRVSSYYENAVGDI